MTESRTEHPAIPLLAFVDSDFEEPDVEHLRRFAVDLALLRDDWVLGTPRFVDETDDEGVRTVGIVHDIHAAFDAAGTLLDEATDRAHLEEVRTLVSGLQRITQATGIDIGFEIDGLSVGWIERGELSDELRLGLLEPWAARFASG